MNKDQALVVATTARGASDATGDCRMSSNASEGSGCMPPRGV
jgi:hypothetical protein